MGIQTGFLRAAVVAAGMALMATAVHAGPKPAPTPAPSLCSILNFTVSTFCISPVPDSGGPGGGGNVTAQDMNALPAFSAIGWSLLDEIGSVSLGNGSQMSSGGLFTFDYDNDLQSGTWSLNPLWTWGTGIFAFVIKGANDNAAYLMDKNFTSGDWTVLDLDPNGNGGPPDLSNVRLFGTSGLVDNPPPPPPPPPVPLPAAGWLMLAGIGGLAALRRRRKAA
jgi:hypothetical protein